MDDDANGPNLTVVSKNSDQEIARSVAWDEASRALVELASNILRVVRGTGRPYSIGRECARVVVAFEEYHSEVGHWPSSEEIGRAIGFDDDPLSENATGAWSDVQFAKSMIVRGALQFAGSGLLQQRPQIHAGDRELMDGVGALTRALEAHRQMVESKFRAQQAVEKRANRAPTKRTPNGGSKKAEVIMIDVPARIQTKEAAMILGVTPRTILNLAVRGELPLAAKIGKVWTFDRAALTNFLPDKEAETQALAWQVKASLSAKKPRGCESPLSAAKAEKAYELMISKWRGGTATRSAQKPRRNSKTAKNRRPQI